MPKYTELVSGGSSLTAEPVFIITSQRVLSFLELICLHRSALRRLAASSPRAILNLLSLKSGSPAFPLILELLPIIQIHLFLVKFIRLGLCRSQPKNSDS